MSDEEDIAALVIDNGSGMCKGKKKVVGVLCVLILLLKQKKGAGVSKI
jgi:hypothetical protein